MLREQKAFAKATKANIGKPIYIIYDNQVISAPNVQEAITKGECTIDGMESYEAAENLASSIRIGSLPVKLNELRSNVVSAKLGVKCDPDNGQSRSHRICTGMLDHDRILCSAWCDCVCGTCDLYADDVISAEWI